MKIIKQNVWLVEQSKYDFLKVDVNINLSINKIKVIKRDYISLIILV